MFSSFDIHEACIELKDIEGMRVDNVYQSEGEIRVKLFGRERRDLVIAKDSFYLTKYIKPAPRIASSFSMFLRKHLKGSPLKKIEQINFDRIVAFFFGYEDRERILVAEVFGDGNIILCNRDWNIMGVLRREEYSSRRIAPNERYLPPPSRLSPRISFEEFERLDIKSEKDMATLFNFGGTYAREIFLRAGSLNKRKIFCAMNSFVKKPCIVEGKEVVPYELLIFEGKQKISFESFIEAADEFYGRHSAQEYERGEEKEKEKEMSRIERIIASQKASLEEYARKREEYKRSGDGLFQHYDVVSRTLEALRGRRGIDTIRNELGEESSCVKSFDPQKGTVTFDFGFPVECDVRLGINENANKYYENAKKMARKIKGAETALQKTMIKEAEKGKEKIEEKKVRTLGRKEWYEKFRWCLSSAGRFMLAGRDAKNNETLIKKHMEPGDIYVHADIHGAAQVVLKDGQKAEEGEIFEVACFAVSYSKSWGRAADAYWVLPEQVTKTPPSGEYLTSGAFFIKGKKNVVKNAFCRTGIGIYEGKMMFGPLEAVKSHCQQYVEIEPSEAKKEELARFISKRLGFEDMDEIVRALPGGGRIRD